MTKNDYKTSLSMQCFGLDFGDRYSLLRGICHSCWKHHDSRNMPFGRKEAFQCLSPILWSSKKMQKALGKGRNRQTVSENVRVVESETPWKYPGTSRRRSRSKSQSKISSGSHTGEYSEEFFSSSPNGVVELCLIICFILLLSFNLSWAAIPGCGTLW